MKRIFGMLFAFVFVFIGLGLLSACVPMDEPEEDEGEDDILEMLQEPTDNTLARQTCKNYAEHAPGLLRDLGLEGNCEDLILGYFDLVGYDSMDRALANHDPGACLYESEFEAMPAFEDGVLENLLRECLDL